MITNILKENNIGVCSYGRKQSQRCPNKMLRTFGDTTVVDILLSKLAHFEENAFFAGHAEEFKGKCLGHNVNFVQRSLKSVTIDEPQTECLSFLKDVNYDYILIVNGCLPFLKTSTISDFLQKVVDNDLRSASAVIARKNYFFDKDKKSLNFSSNLKNLNTKTVEPIYEFANALYFFNRDYFFENGRYWDWDSLNLVELESTMEIIDIDTEEDFLIAEGLWNGKRLSREESK
jgi:spore coat polysaccharide biosynthesis protein SpsF (cytidylyltransferase family)